MDLKYFQQVFTTDFPLNKDGLDELYSSLTYRIFPKNSLLLSAGEREQELRFINNGCIREYYIKDTVEVNSNFFITPQFVNDFTSFIDAVPSKKYLETLQQTELLTISRDVFYNLLTRYQCGKTFIDQNFKMLLREKENEEFYRLTFSPEENYLSIVKRRPEWLQNVPQYHIASYLGITPESLSRLRRKSR
ncbi:MAG: Crp/Fnr family transcriptional regulator [Ignavibacteria bacterium]|nr:Crp/Fnr family transcriptional regulator [Ignavibacteria bacterium]